HSVPTRRSSDLSPSNHLSEFAILKFEHHLVQSCRQSTLGQPAQITTLLRTTTVLRELARQVGKSIRLDLSFLGQLLGLPISLVFFFLTGRLRDDHQNMCNMSTTSSLITPLVLLIIRLELFIARGYYSLVCGGLIQYDIFNIDVVWQSIFVTVHLIPFGDLLITDGLLKQII